MNVRYIVKLSDEEREALRQLIAGGTAKARRIKRAQILLASEQGVADADIAQTVGVGTATVYRVKRRCVEEGPEAALAEMPRPGGTRKLTGHQEALLVALACSAPPTGRACWTMELLAGELVRLTPHERLSRETVRRRLEEKELKPWQEKMWCIPVVDAAFVERMEDVLDLYAEEPDPARPVVCFDEKSYQLIDEVRTPVRAAPGRPRRVDYEYVRNGTVNIFAFVDANRPWREMKVTAHRAALDFAECMRELVDVHYPNAERIRVVLDNLSTHLAKNLYEAFPAPEARRILRRLEFHHTPKHASWLNMVEIELSVLGRQCLDQRIADRDKLAVHVDAWCRDRNQNGHRINWMFRVDDARRKMGRLYPAPAFETELPVAA